MCQNTAKIHDKLVLELNKKRCLKTDPNKLKKTQKMTPTWIPKNDFILGVAPLGEPLVAQTALGHQKWAPSAPKVLPMIEK